MNKKTFVFIFFSLLFTGCQLNGNHSGSQIIPSGNLFKEEMANKEGSIIEIPAIANLSLNELDQKFGHPQHEGKKDFVFSRTYFLNNG
jgi:hypothetical protein